MADIELDTSKVERMLAAVPGKVDAAVGAAIRRACLVVHRESVKNAPISPTNAQYSKAVLKRKKRTSRRLHPGGLSRSIEWAAQGLQGAVYVASNSEAAKYAKKIHDEKYKTWRKRGPGTIAKGTRADEKFIERALNDNRKAIDGLIDRAVANALKLA